MKTKTQTSKILNLLLKGQKISNKQAVEKFQAYRLSGIIHYLRQHYGANIDGAYYNVNGAKKPVYFYFIAK